MNKIFKCEEGNVLRLVMEKPRRQDFTTGIKMAHHWENAMREYNNRESYPYVSQDWKVGDLVPESEFELEDDCSCPFGREVECVRGKKFNKYERCKIAISKPTKP